MGNKNISAELGKYGFKNVRGTVEEVGGGVKAVRRGTPLTWDYNNGVIAIYDEMGEPWIKIGSSMPPTSEMNAMLRRGAYVPHSNDGGHFVHEVLATL